VPPPTENAWRRKSARPVFAVDVGADDRELLVELAVIGPRDFDFVVALLVTDLGVGDPAAAGVCQRGGAGLGKGVAADRPVLVVVFVGGRGDGDAGAGRPAATDPAGIAAAIVEIADRASTPFRLAAGQGAAETIALRDQLGDDGWLELAADADFERRYIPPASKA
jgi:hypothetical protein